MYLVTNTGNQHQYALDLPLSPGFLNFKKINMARFEENIRKYVYHTKYFKIKILSGKSFFRIKIFSLFLPIQLSFHSNADES